MKALRFTATPVLAIGLLLSTGCEMVAERLATTTKATVVVHNPDGEPVALTVSSSRAELCREGYSLLQQARYAEAESQLSAAIAADPTDHKALFGRGLSHELRKQMDQAAEDYAAAADIATDEDDQFLYRGSLARVRTGPTSGSSE